MGILYGGAHIAFSPRARGLSLALRVRHRCCEPRDVTPRICGGVRELGDHRLEATTAQLCLLSRLYGSRV